MDRKENIVRDATVVLRSRGVTPGEKILLKVIEKMILPAGTTFSDYDEEYIKKSLRSKIEG